MNEKVSTTIILSLNSQTNNSRDMCVVNSFPIHSIKVTDV